MDYQFKLFIKAYAYALVYSGISIHKTWCMWVHTYVFQIWCLLKKCNQAKSIRLKKLIFIFIIKWHILMYISHAVMQNGENTNVHVMLKYSAKWQEQSRQPQQLSAVLLLFHPSVWTNQMNNYPELTNRSRRSQLYTTKKEYEINPQYSQPARRESK